jgi:meiotically up-regulated gene 157 (Mug157) protein
MAHAPIPRRAFLSSGLLATAGLLVHKQSWAQSLPFAQEPFVSRRPAISARKFSSPAVEAYIDRVAKKITDPELAWLFTNCFPNTLDTTVEVGTRGGKPDTFVITGDIDAMWLRDSSAQVWPYLPLAKQDKALQRLLAGVIHRQTACILLDPYANAFFADGSTKSYWETDETTMRPGVHERKWEIDSLCYPIRLAHGYWRATGDDSVFDTDWQAAMRLVVQTFTEQQRKTSQGPYHFQRKTTNPIDTQANQGFGNPARPNGMICSMFRPSDDATTFSYLVPSNLFAVISLRQVAELWIALKLDPAFATTCTTLAAEVEAATRQHGVAQHPTAGTIWAYETDGYGNHLFMDDANVPSLLSIPYLVNGMGGSDFLAGPKAKQLYQNTRKYVLSAENPFYFSGGYGEGIGGPHAGMDMVWPLSIIMRGITSTDDTEIKHCLDMLQNCHAGTGFMHESFNKDNAANFTRKWFAWANNIFGEFIWKVYREKPHLLR